MGFWGKPNIAKLIDNHDIKGLHKACQYPDNTIRKGAVLALVQMNQLLPVFQLIFILIDDQDENVREVAYFYNYLGEFGLYSLIAAIHDPSKRIRFKAVALLREFHKKATPILVRIAQFDPEHEVRHEANTSLEKIGLEPQLWNQSAGLQLNNNWFSAKFLLGDLLMMIQKDKEFNPGYRCRNGGFYYPYSSPLMATCIHRFSEAYKCIETDRSKAVQLIDSVLSLGIEGLNSFSRDVAPAESLRVGYLPYSDYNTCATIMLVKLGVT